jgi:hypothetical protein
MREIPQAPAPAPLPAPQSPQIRPQPMVPQGGRQPNEQNVPNAPPGPPGPRSSAPEGHHLAIRSPRDQERAG